jgi:PhnB protein
MATNSVYLNYTGQAEEAFNFYKSVFGTEFIGGIMRHGDVPAMEGMPVLDDATRQMVMNVQLPITGGLLLMASDIFPGMGDPIVPGNNFSIGIHVDSKEEADRIFAALSAGGNVSQPMEDQFWGDYYGSFNDKFGIPWYVVVTAQQ